MKVTWIRTVLLMLAFYHWVEREKFMRFWSMYKYAIKSISKGILSVYVIAPLFKTLYAPASSKKEVCEALDHAIKYLFKKHQKKSFQ